MIPCPVRDPIFVIGMPRSGTTILFEALARHPHLGWPTNYCRLFPTAQWMNVFRRILDNDLIQLHGNIKQYRGAPALNLLLPQPSEAYEFWDAYAGVCFSRDALRCRPSDADARARLRDAVGRILAWQHRPRFAAKLTGPPRIEFLRSVFPDSYFVHVIRDARAVAHSLINVSFWRNSGGLEQPFWSDLMRSEDVEIWRRSARDPAVLAALQWKCVIELARLEARGVPPDRYVEVRYESFTGGPHAVLEQILDACGLPDAAAVRESIDRGPALRNMNDKFRSDFSPERLALVTDSVQPILHDLGYA